MSKPDPLRKSSEHSTMSTDWALIRAVRGGTRTMREARETWLPRHRNETDAHYDARLNSTFLKNMLEDAIDNMTGKTFAKPVALAGEYDKRFDEWVENIDLKGGDLHAFSRELYKEGVSMAVSFIIVDTPQAPVGEDGRAKQLTLDDEKKLGLRPYFRIVKAEDLIAAYVDTSTGVPVISHARVREGDSITLNDQFEETRTIRVKEWSPGEWKLWQKIGDGEWAVAANGVNPLGYVPLVGFIAGEKTGNFSAKPIFRDLAFKCVEYWQSHSDQRNALRYARFPMLYATGVDLADGQELTVGPGKLLHAPDAGAKFGYVETTGQAIEHGAKDLERIVDEGNAMGLKPFIQRTGTQVATARALDEAQANSVAQTLALNEQDALERAFEIMGAYVGIDKKACPAVSVHTDFGISTSAEGEVKNLIEMRLAGQISRQTFYEELQRRNLLGPQFNHDEEVNRLKSEDPLGMPGEDDTDEGDDLAQAA